MESPAPGNYEAFVMAQSRDLVVIGEDVVLPAVFTVRVKIDGEPGTAVVECRVNAQKKVEPWSLHVESADDGPLTALLLRSVRIGEVVRIATQSVTRKVEPVQGTDDHQDAARMGYMDTVRGAALARREPRVRRGKTGDHATLERVAAIWHANPKSPVKSVQGSEHVSRSTAVRMIHKAREAGLVPEREEGKR